MKVITLILLLVFISPLVAYANKVGYTKHKARITFYSPYQDKWGWLNADPTSKRSKQGLTVAAHPDFKFGTQVYIPKLKGTVGDGYFIVQDRRSAVTRKTAAKGRAYVFDVFVAKPSYRRKLGRNQAEYMDVYVKTKTQPKKFQIIG